MFCKNCGAQYMTDEAVICVKCGAQKGVGFNFCPNCGQPIQPNSAVCLNCGVAVGPSAPAGQQKSKLAAGLFGIFLGAFGVHNFYMGYTTKAIVQLCCTIAGILLSCLGIGVLIVLGIEIWGLVEGIMVLTGHISADAKGVPLKD